MDNEIAAKLAGIPGWLRGFGEAKLKERIFNLGMLTGWKKKEDGGFGPANFERALILTKLVELICPGEALEVGTGRGLGCLAMASAAQELGIDLKITSLDINTPNLKQTWPIRLSGKDQVINASVEEVWAAHISNDLRKNIKFVTGSTTSTMAALAADGKKFDLIFIDAGHDAHSVIHDLARSITLLNPGGVVLMDDFAPLDEYGLGTCLAIPHARRFFRYVNVFHTEGLVYGGSDNPEFPRAMVLLAGPGKTEGAGGMFSMAVWRLADVMLRYLYKPKSFPLKAPEGK
ncbi:MAG: class I SAM-dependent methyltransferase [Nitrospinae bacterium]|nr:class I SAM-dependent methyltransferase [Nitrospinota bacterium]